MTTTTAVEDLPDLALPSPPPSSRGPSRSVWERAVVSALPAVLVTSALFGWMVWRSQDGLNTAGLQMPAMDLQHRVAYWWPFLMGETLGIAALIWSYLSVAIGLAFSTRSTRLGLSRRQLNELHRSVSLTSIFLIAGHVLFVAIGSMNGAMDTRTVDVSEALLPFQTSWNAQFYNVGVFAFYLSLLLGPTYYLRRRIGVRVWKAAHRASLAVYILAVWHTIGFDDFDFHGPYRLALWIAQIPLAALLVWRLIAPSSSGRGRANGRVLAGRLGAAVAATAALVILVLVVITGHIGGEASPFSHHTPSTNPAGKATPRPAPGPMKSMPGM